MSNTNKDGTVIRGGGASIDCSNIANGYITVSHNGADNQKRKARINRQQLFSLPLDGLAKALPLCFGDGDYLLEVFRQISGEKYSTLISQTVEVKLNSQFEPYIHPNTYCEYNSGSLCVDKAAKVCTGITGDAGRVKAIYRYVADNVSYDAKLAESVQEKKEWLPDPDEVMWTGKTICWGYASLMAAMCRSQGIPCKICVGWSGEVWHAWNEVYTRDCGNIYGVAVKAGAWNRFDATFMDSSNCSAAAIALIENDKAWQVSYYG